MPGREMKWWGWGSADTSHEIPEGGRKALREELGDPEPSQRIQDVEDAKVGDSQLRGKVRRKFADTVGEENVRTDTEERVLHAAGKSYPDLIRQRRGECDDAPDAIVYPRTDREVRAVLKTCNKHGIAVVPFGGGTSVVGGLAPIRGEFEALIALDLAHLNQVVKVDRRSLVASFGAGIAAVDAEQALAPHGLTIGHFPQSYEFVTLGGCVATRSSGQASAGYGRIDSMLVGAKLQAPAGTIDLPALPPNASGPDLRQLVAGSEGLFGPITEVSLKVKPAPTVKRYEGVLFHSFAEGADVLRQLAQHGVAPDVCRLSDEEETRITLTLAGDGLKAKLGKLAMRAKGFDGGCLAMFGWEGDNDSVARRRRESMRIIRQASVMELGTTAGDAWSRSRFAGPYLRDALLDQGVFVETLETVTLWSGQQELYEAVRTALKDSLSGLGTPPIVGCHVSHVYPSGGSLYFTFLARQLHGSELKQWRVAKQAACEAIVSCGAAISHHHAVGKDHAPYLAAEQSELGIDALRAVKQRLDPAGIMNPGKLLFG